jgi:hypothetical protein
MVHTTKSDFRMPRKKEKSLVRIIKNESGQYGKRYISSSRKQNRLP